MEEIVKYRTEGGSEIALTLEDVKTLVTGNRDISRKEFVYFANICKSQGLNPLAKEAYLIKYGDSPASIVVSKDVFLKRASANPRFKGLTAGITVATREGRLERREGSLCFPNETLLGGWCKVYVDGYENPMFDEVSLSEYMQTRWNDREKRHEPAGNWKSKPATMIRKVAIVHALRETFSELGGLYDESEIARPQHESRAEPAKPEKSALDRYRQALVDAKGRGVGIKEAMGAVEASIGKKPEEYAEEDVLRAVEIVNGLAADGEEIAY